MDVSITEIVIGIYLSIISLFGLRKVSVMENKLAELDKETGVQDARITAIDGNHKEIKLMLKQIASDLGDLKQEQALWRGRNEQQQH